jgi:hypothetical protein
MGCISRYDDVTSLIDGGLYAVAACATFAAPHLFRQLSVLVNAPHSAQFNVNLAFVASFT